VSRSLPSPLARLRVAASADASPLAHESSRAPLLGVAFEWLVLALCPVIVGAVALDRAGVPLGAGSVGIVAAVIVALLLIPAMSHSRRLMA
jgi:hypothetical protein